MLRPSQLRKYSGHNYGSIRFVGFSTADLSFHNFGASLKGFIGIMYSSRLISAVTIWRADRVTDHLVHMGTSSYQRTHEMTSPISIFLQFLFLWMQVCLQKPRKFLPVNVSSYTVLIWVCMALDLIFSGSSFQNAIQEQIFHVVSHTTIFACIGVPRAIGCIL